jgi:hypothetical protein
MSEYNDPFPVSDDVKDFLDERYLYENKVRRLFGEEPVMYSKFKKGVMQYLQKMGMIEPSAGDLVFQALFVWVIIGIVVRLICSAQEKGLVSGGNGELMKVDEKGIKIGENYVDIKSLFENLKLHIEILNEYKINCIQSKTGLIVEAIKGKITISHKFDENFMRGLLFIVYKMAEKHKNIKGGKKASKFRKHTKKSKSKRVKKSKKNNKSKKA